MKKILLLLLIAVSATAQSVEISPGNILPRMTTAQRNAISSPKPGTLLFNTTTNVYEYWGGNNWITLSTGSNFWTLNGTGGSVIKNTNTGGFWSANPSMVPPNATNTTHPPTAPVSGAGTRLMWIPSRSAFRVGTVTGVHWDADSIGVNSTAMGYNTTASEWSSTAMGSETTASGQASTAMGAYSTASGVGSTAMGYNTTASGWYSTAMGRQTTASGLTSTAMGSLVNTNAKSGAFMIGDQNSGASLLSAPTANRFYARFRNGYALYTNAANTIGVQLAANGNAWATISDSTRKENFLPAHTETVLQSVAQMRIGTWNYKGQDPAQYRHWGVMAQDFHRHFGKDPYGTIGNDTTIATADFDGVAFAALKGLEARTRALGTQYSALETKYSLLTTHYSELATRNSELESSLRQAQGDNAALREDLNQLRALVESLIAEKNRLAAGQVFPDH